LKVLLPEEANRPPTLLEQRRLDPRLPAKKMPKFSEFGGMVPGRFDPCLPLKKSIPAALLEA
jgi:hypothetical protein